MRSTNSLEYETHAVKFFLMLACHYALNHTGIVTFDCIKTKQTGFLLKWSITQGTHWNRAMSYSWPHMSEHFLISWELQHCHIPKKKYWRFFTMLLTCMSNTSSLRLWFFSHLLRYVIPFCSARAYVSVNWIYLASFQHKKDKYDDPSSCHITLFLQAWKIPAAQHKQWILYLCEFIFKIVLKNSNNNNINNNNNNTGNYNSSPFV